MHSRRIVRAVDHRMQVSARKNLKARRMMHRTQRSTQRRFCNTCILAFQQLRRHDDQRRILRLISACKRKLERLRFAADNRMKGKLLPALLGKGQLRRKILAIDEYIGAELLRPPFDDLEGLPRCRRNDGYPFLDNARLVLRDSRERPAAAVGMLHCHIRNDRKCRLNDIRRVEKSAKTRFDDGSLNVLLRKIEEGKCCQCLELRRMLMPLGSHFIRRCAHAREERGERFLGNIMAVCTHAFRIGDEVRRKVTSGADAGSTEDSIHHLRCRPLAVRSRNVDRRIGTLRVPKARTEFLHARKAQTNAECIQFIQIEK